MAYELTLRELLESLHGMNLDKKVKICVNGELYDIETVSSQSLGFIILSNE